MKRQHSIASNNARDATRSSLCENRTAEENTIIDSDDPSFKKQKLATTNVDDSSVLVGIVPGGGSSLNILVHYDPYVLRHIFTFCSFQDFTSLAVICREWNSSFFSKKEHILQLCKEWMEQKWKKLCCGGGGDNVGTDLGKHNQQVVVTPLFWDFDDHQLPEEHNYLPYWPRLIKVLDFGFSDKEKQEEKQEEEQDEELEDDEDEEEDSEDSEDDEEEDNEEQSDDEEEEQEEEDDEEGLKEGGTQESKKSEPQISIICDKISSSLEMIEMDSVKLCVIHLDTNHFIIVSKKYGNIILFKRKKKKVKCLFYGSLAYPSLEHCNYRSNYWVSIHPSQKGIFILQLQQIAQYLGLDAENYEIGCKIQQIIGIKAKISKSNYEMYNWDEGEADGGVQFFPWDFIRIVTDPTDMSYMCDPYSFENSPTGIVDIIDDRVFIDFELFTNTLSGFSDLEQSIIEEFLSRVDKSLLSKREILPALKNRALLFNFLDDSLRHDREFIMEALKVVPSLLRTLFKKQYRNIITIDRELIIKCLRMGCRLSELPEHVKIDKEMVYAAIRGGSKLDDSIPEEFQTRDTIILALKKDPFTVLHSVREIISSDRDLALEIVQYGSYPMSWINKKVLIKFPEIQEMAIKNYFGSIQYCTDPENPSLIKLAKKSLLSLLELPEKKIKFSFKFRTIDSNNNGKIIKVKSSRMVEVSKKNLQTIFLIEREFCLHGAIEDSREHTSKYVLLYGPCIKEKGYNARMRISFKTPTTTEEETKRETLKEQIILDTLDSLSRRWKSEPHLFKFSKEVRAFLNPTLSDDSSNNNDIDH